MAEEDRPQYTLYNLQTSRSIRIAWLIEELGVTYDIVHADRQPNGLSSNDFKEEIGTFLGKAPVLKDHELEIMIQESGAITEYLLEREDHNGRLMPKLEILNRHEDRSQIREFIHAAEGSIMVHALPYIYARRISREAAEMLKPGLQAIVAKDLDWVEHHFIRKVEEARRSEDLGWLIGWEVTAADTMMGFSVQFVLVNELAGKDEDVKGKWPKVRRWLKMIEGREAYHRAVKKTGFVLQPQEDGHA